MNAEASPCHRRQLGSSREGVTQQNEIQLPPEANLVLHLLDATNTYALHHHVLLSGSSTYFTVLFFQSLPPTPPSRETRLPSQDCDSQSLWLIPQITYPARTPITVLVFTKGASCLAVPKPYGFRCLKMHRTVAMAFLELLSGILPQCSRTEQTSCGYRQNNGPRLYL